MRRMSMKSKKLLQKTGKKFILSCLTGALGALSWYTLREYRPQKAESLSPPKGRRLLSPADPFRLLTWNIGFAGFDSSMDFFMDGGKMVRPRSKSQVFRNMKGIGKILTSCTADAYFLQEVDLDSSRSYHMDQQDYFEKRMGLPGVFAWNYKCDFIPFPLPPLGKMSSGISTFTDLKVRSARRLALPESFSWPVKTCNLKRCILEARIPVKGSSRELVLLNFHLEAYDKGEGKLAQSRLLSQILSREYEKGNYVIAGGDFNQIIKGEDKYPLRKSKNWTPDLLEKDFLPPHFSIAADDTWPTCRLLDRPYDGSMEKGRVYVLDGFLVSDNLQISGKSLAYVLDGFLVSDNLKISRVSVINTDFAYTDHQPVILEVQFLDKNPYCPQSL